MHCNGIQHSLIDGPWQKVWRQCQWPIDGDAMAHGWAALGSQPGQLEKHFSTSNLNAEDYRWHIPVTSRDWKILNA